MIRICGGGRQLGTRNGKRFLRRGRVGVIPVRGRTSTLLILLSCAAVAWMMLRERNAGDAQVVAAGRSVATPTATVPSAAERAPTRTQLASPNAAVSSAARG